MIVLLKWWFFHGYVNVYQRVSFWRALKFSKCWTPKRVGWSIIWSAENPQTRLKFLWCECLFINPMDIIVRSTINQRIQPQTYLNWTLSEGGPILHRWNITEIYSSKSLHNVSKSMVRGSPNKRPPPKKTTWLTPQFIPREDINSNGKWLTVGTPSKSSLSVINCSVVN